jgi:hypothetical protein
MESQQHSPGCSIPTAEGASALPVGSCQYYKHRNSFSRSSMVVSVATVIIVDYGDTKATGRLVGPRSCQGEGEQMKVSYWVLALVFTVFGTICSSGLIVYVFQDRDERNIFVSALLIVMLALLTWSGVSQTLHHLVKVFY